MDDDPIINGENVTNEEKRQFITRLEKLAVSVLPEVKRARRPFFIEFSGTPKSGKTFYVDRLALFMRRMDFSVRVLAERASIAPITRKDHMFFNVWTGCATLNQVLEALEREDFNIIIADRGIFDAMCWMDWLEHTARMTSSERETIGKFLMMDRWRNLMDIVFLLTVEPAQAMHREYRELLTTRQGGIMNEITLQQFNDAVNRTYEQVGRCFPSVHRIDTTRRSPMHGIAEVTQKALETLDGFLHEKVLVIKSEDLDRTGFHAGFAGAGSPAVSGVQELISRTLLEDRRIAEENLSLVQIVPIALFKYEDQLLMLRIREEDTHHRLHNKYSVWAGGHVRQGDLKEGSDPVLNCLNRELNEELYIRAALKPEFIGVVRDVSNVKSMTHLGMVFLVKVESRDIHLSLQQREFKERKGRSLSVQFLPISEMPKHSKEMEVWSKIIIRDFFKAPIELAAEGQLILFEGLR